MTIRIFSKDNKLHTIDEKTLADVLSVIIDDKGELKKGCIPRVQTVKGLNVVINESSLKNVVMWWRANNAINR